MQCVCMVEHIFKNQVTIVVMFISNVFKLLLLVILISMANTCNGYTQLEQELITFETSKTSIS